MFEQLEILQMAHAKAGHAATRQSVIARNVANADTPGYRARDVEDFASYFTNARVDASRRMADQRLDLLGRPRPGALAPAREVRVADAQGPSSPNGNNVSLEAEMMRAVEARHQHEMALNIYRSASTILRTSLGR